MISPASASKQPMIKTIITRGNKLSHLFRVLHYWRRDNQLKSINPNRHARQYRQYCSSEFHSHPQKTRKGPPGSPTRYQQAVDAQKVEGTVAFYSAVHPGKRQNHAQPGSSNAIGTAQLANNSDRPTNTNAVVVSVRHERIPSVLTRVASTVGQ